MSPRSATCTSSWSCWCANLIISRTWFQDVGKILATFTQSLQSSTILTYRIIIYGTWSSANEHLCTFVRLFIAINHVFWFSHWYAFGCFLCGTSFCQLHLPTAYHFPSVRLFVNNSKGDRFKHIGRIPCLLNIVNSHRADIWLIWIVLSDRTTKEIPTCIEQREIASASLSDAPYDSPYPHIIR